MNDKKRLICPPSNVVIPIELYSINGILLRFISGLITAYSSHTLIDKIKTYKAPRSIGDLSMVLTFFGLIRSLLFIARPFLKATLNKKMPRKIKPPLRTIVSKIKDALSCCDRRKTLLCLSRGVIYNIKLLLTRLNFALVIAIFKVIFEYAFTQFLTWTNIVLSLGGFVICQIMERRVFSPYLIVKRISLHLVWIILIFFAEASFSRFTVLIMALSTAAAICFGEGIYNLKPVKVST
jgi:predicted PurR-regulated permease PerM